MMQSCGMHEKLKFALFSVEQEKGTCNISITSRMTHLTDKWQKHRKFSL